MTASEQQLQSRARGRRLRVLVADDEKNIADTIRIILSKEGIEAAAVYGGWAAVEKAAEWEPDVLLIDYVMPDLNGIEAARKICERLTRCKVLVLSAMAEVREVKQGMQRCDKAYEVLVKPIHPEELLRRIRAISD